MNKPPTITHEDIVEAWEDRAEDVFVSNMGHAFYLGGQVAGPKDGNPDWRAIREWMDRKEYWPNVWYFSDHGNTELVSIDESGEAHFLGGLV